MKRLWVYFSVGFLALIALQACGHAAPPPFRAAVEAHLAAIAARDMDALLPTLTQGENLTMLMPSGQKFDTKQQYIDFHRQWFAVQNDGKFEVVEYSRFIESPALSQVFLKYRYSYKDAAGEPQTMVNWLTLTFALEEGAWRLVFDQNTPTEPPRK
jgi:ketosteroid isomerase-like protein